MGRWFLIFGIIVLAAIILLGIWAIPAHGTIDYDTAVITVHYGDTLTGYAREYAPDMDVREYVAKVRELNGMTSGMIYAGDDLVIVKEKRKEKNDESI